MQKRMSIIYNLISPEKIGILAVSFVQQTILVTDRALYWGRITGCDLILNIGKIFKKIRSAVNSCLRIQLTGNN